MHDVSWGTKGDNKVSTDLGVVNAGKGDNKNEVEVAVPTAETDINAAYEDVIHVLTSKPPKAESMQSSHESASLNNLTNSLLDRFGQRGCPV